MVHRNKERTKWAFDENEDKKWRDIYGPVATELGHAVIAWNRMHDNLGLLFTQVLGLKAKEPTKMLAALAVWHSSDNDRIMREALLEAAAARFSGRRKAIFEDIKWLVDRARSLAADRNTAVHALFKIIEESDGSFKVVPDADSGHPKSLKLKNADLVAEFKSYALCATLLSHHAEMIAGHLWNSHEYAWRERPVLPPKWQHMTQAEQRQQKADKSRLRRQQSARASAGKLRKP